MPRPSRNLDRALLAAGRALLPHRGCAGLSVREVADAAGVNLGMFHYHFKTREAFLRALLQSTYEEMFSQLTVRSRPPDNGVADPVDMLRNALRFLGRFLRDNRPLLARVLGDALCGDPIAIDFLRANLPRHLGVMQQLVELAQREGRLRPMPVPQALGFCAGSLALPVIFGGAVADGGLLPAPAARALHAALLADAALDERIDLALAALTLPAPPAPPRPRRANPRKKNP